MVELNDFKDCLFDLINETYTMDVSDIETDDKNSTFFVTISDGSRFKIVCGICST